MRAITIDDDLIEYDDSLNTFGAFKEVYRQEVYEDEEYPTIVMMDPSTYVEMRDEMMMQSHIVYLLIVVSETLIHEAVEKNYIKLVEFLLDNGYGDVTETDDDLRTPLSYCTDPDLCTILIQAGADVNHVDVDENTPMHHLLLKLIGELATMANVEKIHSVVRTLHVLSWNGADADYENQEDVSCRELYHTVFPESQLNDEDPELRFFFSSTSSSTSYGDEDDGKGPEMEMEM